MARKKIDRKDKKCYREFVWLAEAEYAHLCELLGKDQTERWLDELNLHLGSKGDKYESHYYTIQVWARRAKQADKPASLQAGQLKTEAQRSADRVCEALRDAAKRSWPYFDERIKAAVFAVLKNRRATWPLLHDECREDPEAVSVFRIEFERAYKEVS